MAAKYRAIAALLERRILNGDYALKDLPSVRALAAEASVSYVTAQRALVELERRGAIYRLPTGRVEVNRSPAHAGPGMQLAFLTPTFKSQNIDQWRAAITRAAEARGFKVRPVLYMHWEDPHLTDVFSSFDGAFLVPLPTPAPDSVLARLRKAPRLVALDENLTHVGIPSLMLMPPVALQLVLDHLYALGHRRIDCLNVQPISPIIEQRIEQWHVWMAVHHCQGRLINAPVAMSTFPYGQARQVMAQVLEAGDFTASALVGITLPAAIGALRAFHTHGLRAGEQVSVCAMDSEDLAPYLTPSITTLEDADPTPYIEISLDWMAGGGGWTGPLLMGPRDLRVIARESTGPA
jgi:DNA-binding LacI/PurR family transcriptional regulator